MLKDIKVNIFANGNNLKEFSLLEEDFNIVLDGFANELIDKETLPSLIIGDLDSIKKRNVEYYKSQSVELVKIDCQNTSDLEKALIYCVDNKYNDISIYNALGGRLDHQIHNIGLLKKYDRTIEKLKMINLDEELIFVRDSKITFETYDQKRFSIMPFTEANITSQGLKYEMNKYNLIQSQKESSSNCTEKESGEVLIKGDVLLVLEFGINYNIVPLKK